MSTPESTYSIDNHHGSRLLELARSALEYRLGLSSGVNRSDLDEESFRQQCGTFVTLKNNKVLRGCIGNLEADGSIVDAVERNALNAAFNDHRFQPLKAEELDGITIDISILSRPEVLDYRDSEDLISKLRPMVDGVILRHGKKGATFLPQVWAQLPDPEQFLEHLCRKAGLEADAWQDPDLEVSTYQVQYFKDHE